MSPTDCGLRRHCSNPKPLIRSHSPDLWLGKHQGARLGPCLPQRPEARSQGWDRRGEGPRHGGMARREGHRHGAAGAGGIRGLRHQGVLGLDPSTSRL